MDSTTGSSHENDLYAISRINADARFHFGPREVKRCADFVALASRYTKLRRAGRQFVGLCPFHSESNPSFFVEPQRKIWKCFGCDAGGDIFDFVMRAEECGFLDAVRIVAGVAPAREPRSGSRLGGRVGGEAPSARGACALSSPQTAHAAAIAELEATEQRNAAIRAANDADAAEFATACEPRDGDAGSREVQFIRHRITSQETDEVQRGRS